MGTPGYLSRIADVNARSIRTRAADGITAVTVNGDNVPRDGTAYTHHDSNGFSIDWKITVLVAQGPTNWTIYIRRHSTGDNAAISQQVLVQPGVQTDISFSRVPGFVPDDLDIMLWNGTSFVDTWPVHLVSGLPPNPTPTTPPPNPWTDYRWGWWVNRLANLSPADLQASSLNPADYQTVPCGVKIPIVKPEGSLNTALGLFFATGPSFYLALFEDGVIVRQPLLIPGNRSIDSADSFIQYVASTSKVRTLTWKWLEATVGGPATFDYSQWHAGGSCQFVFTTTVTSPMSVSGAPISGALPPQSLTAPVYAPQPIINAPGLPTQPFVQRPIPYPSVRPGSGGHLNPFPLDESSGNNEDVARIPGITGPYAGILLTKSQRDAVLGGYDPLNILPPGSNGKPFGQSQPVVPVPPPLPPPVAHSPITDTLTVITLPLLPYYHALLAFLGGLLR